MTFSIFNGIIKTMDKFDKKIITFYTFFWVVVILIVGSIAVCVCDIELNTKNKDITSTPYYSSKIKEFETQNKTLTNVDVCFLGDSLIEEYKVENYYENLNVVNRGIKGDTTLSLKNRLNVSAVQIKPKVIVMLIGRNNLDTMSDNYDMLLRFLKSEVPQSKVVVLSLIPNSGEYSTNNEKILENNEKIKKLKKDFSFEYVDVYTPLLDETSKLNSAFTTDGKSLNTSGYETLTNIVRPVVLDVLKK